MSRLRELLTEFDDIHGTLPIGAKTADMADAARVFEIAEFWVDPMMVAVKGDVTGKAQRDIAFLIGIINRLTSD